ncbi:putative GNAT family acetyltransferase [Arthrobacter sp. CAN_A214]|uniref:GNAT family N-acetyltransferase n=1 Tax=Arthrobacter sp. CAN_A214 TaxID=2787720 RepID=UPI0018C984E1
MENVPLVLDRLHSPVVQQSPPPFVAPSGPGSSIDPQLDETGFPVDLTVVPTRQLRVLCNQVYRLLDRDYPPMESREQYESLVEELERRETIAETRVVPPDPRGTFRDNPLFSRFELFQNGRMAGYVKYEMHGGDVLLLQAVVDPRFHRAEVEPLLIQHVLLNAHRRRLAVAPYCPQVREFLTENPHYLALLPTRQRHRVELLIADAELHEV